MKRESIRILSKNAAVIALGGFAVCAQAQNLVTNGDFSEQTNGTQIVMSLTTGGKIHSNDVFTDWRIFSVGTPPVSNFTGTIMANPVAAGNLAIRLDYTNNVGASGPDWGLDRWDSKIRVSYGSGYTVSFDAAYISGSTSLRFGVTEFTNGVSLGTVLTRYVAVSNTNYQHYAFNYTPSTSNVSVSVGFKPLDTGTTNTASLSLDNVWITPLSILNGSFEAQVAGITKPISGGGGTVIDTSTFSNWRLFSVSPPSGSPSTATVVTNATDHNVGLRYDVSIVGGSPSDYALDRDNSKVPVTVGIRYKISFDAAYIGGGSNLLFGVAEHNRNQTSLKGTTYNVVVTNMNYQTYSFFWTPTTNETAYVNLAFRIRPQGGFKTSSMAFDNVRLDRAVAAVSFTNLLQICDGTPKSVAVVTDPPGLTVDVTYDGASAAPSGLGSHTVVGTVRETNYEPTSVTNTLMIVTPFAPIAGGGFENLALGAVVGGGSSYTNTADFAPWRIYNVASGNGTFFTGTVVSAASEGTRALRLDLVSPDLANAACALDRFVQGTFLPVNPAARYLVTFDAARISGSPRFRVVVPEYNDTPAYLSKQATYFFDLPGTNYQTLSFVWSPQSASVTQIALGFTPWCVATNTSASYLVDNVCLTPLGEVALRGLTQDYDGTAKSVSAVTDPPGLPVALTYNGLASAPSNGGVYTVVGAVTNALYACSVTNLFLIKDAGVAQLKTNGSFEAQSAGTTVSIGPAGTVDTTTFSGWRFFNVGSPAVSNFTATIVPDASEGDVGMRLGFIDAGGVSADHGLDCENVAKMPVAYGTRYKVSFDAAWDSDSRKVDVGVPEYKSSGVYAGVGKVYTVFANSTNYQNFAFVWTPVSNVTAWANLAFRQRSSGSYTASVMRFDNVRFDPLVAVVSLTNLVHSYNDTSMAATASTSPGGLPVTFTYNGSATVPTEPGRYTVVGTVSDAYFSGCVTNTLVIHGPLGTVMSVR